MLVVEIVILGGTMILAMLAYVNYTRSDQFLKHSRAQCREIEEIHNRAQQRYEEIVQARDKAVKEAERIASFWQAERWN